MYTYFPQANGEVERQNRSLLKAIRTLQVEKADWRKEIDSVSEGFPSYSRIC